MAQSTKHMKNMRQLHSILNSESGSTFVKQANQLCKTYNLGISSKKTSSRARTTNRMRPERSSCHN